MKKWWQQFRKKVITSVQKEEDCLKEVDDKIALGALLWIIAEADEKFLPAEEEKIKEVLTSYSNISKEDLPLVLTSIRQAVKEKIDLFYFSKEVKEELDYPARINIVKQLFRIACADGELAEVELETIRKIAHLFYISHKDFIKAKIEVKKELGLDTIE